MSKEVVDVAEALERIGGEEEFLFELLHEFVQQLEDMLPSLSKAVNSSDYENIKLIAHSLRGAAGNLSINGMHNDLSEIESLARNQKIDMMGILVEKVYKESSDLKEFLKSNS